MAEDKTVVKKTMPRSGVMKKTAARKGSEAAAPPAEPASPSSRRKSVKTADPGAPAAARARRRSVTTPPSNNPADQQDDQQDLLRQLATASEEQRLAMIREAAYYKAEKRQFTPGHEVEDWAAAEREIDELIARAKLMTGL